MDLPSERRARSPSPHGLALALAAWLGLLACGPPPRELWVRFPGPVDLAIGADVRYQGVPIGRVTSLELHQETPTSPASVDVGIRIDDPDVTLRAADVFRIETDGLLGAGHVAIVAAARPSEPLPPGARVEGTAPIAQRVRRGAHEAIDALGDLAHEHAEALIGILTEIEGSSAPSPGVPDAGVPDAGVPDAGAPDAGAPDAGAPHAPPAGPDVPAPADPPRPR